MAECTNCGRPRYPDSFALCGRCSPIVAGGQGRSSEEITEAAMALRDLTLMLAGGVGALLIGWMVYRAVVG